MIVTQFKYRYRLRPLPITAADRSSRCARLASTPRTARAAQGTVIMRGNVAQPTPHNAIIMRGNSNIQIAARLLHNERCQGGREAFMAAKRTSRKSKTSSVA